MWLFKRNPSASLRGVKLPSGLVADWDPEFPMGLAIVVPSGAEISDDENAYAYRMHFGGRRNLLDDSNVIFLHSEKSRTDKRIKARCYFKICIRAKAACDPDTYGNEMPEIAAAVAKSYEEGIDIDDEAAEAALLSNEQGSVFRALGTWAFNDHSEKHQPMLSYCTSGSAIDGGAIFNDASSSGNAQSQRPGKPNARLASEALSSACEGQHQPLTHSSQRAKAIAEQLMNLANDDAAHQMASTSPISVSALASWPRTHMVLPKVREPISFADSSEALTLMEEKSEQAATSLELAADSYSNSNSNSN